MIEQLRRPTLYSDKEATEICYPVIEQLLILALLYSTGGATETC